MTSIIRIPESKMRSEFFRILRSVGFSIDKADKCSEIFTTNSLEGIYSHGVNRFPRFIKNTIDGFIKSDAEPTLTHSAGALEQWNGNLGPGPLNAAFATNRAMTLASKGGIGLVALANTNHWMRGGTYAWQTAREGYVFIGWTNTDANMPAWGAIDARLGNNPLVLGLPFEDEAIVLDFAMTQFSYGKMEAYQMEGKNLPFPGGFNKAGELSSDPAEILDTKRPLPIGYWKGSGLSLLLDILAAILSGGMATHEITKNGNEAGLSQVFIAISLDKLADIKSVDNIVKRIITDFKKSEKENLNTSVRYPGESVLIVRGENTRNGIPVNRIIWEKIMAL